MRNYLFWTKVPESITIQIMKAQIFVLIKTPYFLLTLILESLILTATSPTLKICFQSLNNKYLTSRPYLDAFLPGSEVIKGIQNCFRSVNWKTIAKQKEQALAYSNVNFDTYVFFISKCDTGFQLVLLFFRVFFFLRAIKWISHIRSSPPRGILWNSCCERF